MRCFLGATILLLCLGPARAQVGNELPPPSDAGTPGTVRVSSPQPPAPADYVGVPWNPDVKTGSMWPYPKPVPVPTVFVGPPGDFYLGVDYLCWGVRAGPVPAAASIIPTSLLGVPGYALYYWLTRLEGSDVDLTTAMWVSRVTGSVIPALLFLWFFHRWLSRRGGSPMVVS